jgi:glycosyltransferase involved in cell wall biosynthesis
VSKVAISVSTYLKNDALKGWLESTKELGNFLSCINVSDDAEGNAEEVVKEFEKNSEIPITYCTGKNGGISVNKNRGIKWFLQSNEAKDCDYLILSDDDIVFTYSSYDNTYLLDQIIKAHENSGMPQITGYLGGNFMQVLEDGIVKLDGDPFFKQFPPVAEDEMLYYCKGSQGIFLSFTRQAIEYAEYFDVLSYRYGYEHALYSNRINRIFGYTPEVCPILKNCHRYFHCQNIPNNYGVDPEGLAKNAKDYQKRLQEVYTGYSLKKISPGF